jgi:hypothetical protein
VTPRSGTVLRGLAIAVALVIVLAAALEIGARIWLRARGHPLDAEARRAVVAGVCEAMTNHGEVADDLEPRDPTAQHEDRPLLEPFVAWQDAATEARMIDDAEAYARPDSKAAFDVLLLGGASAAELGASNALADALRADPRSQGRGLRLHVYAQAGFKEPQSLMLLGYLFSLGHEPDLVLAVDGRDEARIGESNAATGTHPLFPSVQHWERASRGMRADWDLVRRIHAVKAQRDEARGFGERILRHGLHESAFLGHIALGRLATLEDRALRAGNDLEAYVASRPRDAELQGPRFDASAAAVAETIAGGWERAVKLLHAMCAARGIEFLEVLEPIPAAEDGPVVASVRAAAERLRAAGVPVEDVSRLGANGPRLGANGGTDHAADALAGAIAAALARPSMRGR